MISCTLQRHEEEGSVCTWAVKTVADSNKFLALCRHTQGPPYEEAVILSTQLNWICGGVCGNVSEGGLMINDVMSGGKSGL